MNYAAFWRLFLIPILAAQLRNLFIPSSGASAIDKKRNTVGMAKMLVNDFGGVVSSDINDYKLPGVGRKTANVIASVVFNYGFGG